MKEIIKRLSLAIMLLTVLAIGEALGQTSGSRSPESGWKLRREYKIVRINGGPNGFYAIDEKLTGGRDSVDRYYQYCIDPGYDKGNWTKGTPLAPPRLVAYAEKQIESGVHSGTHVEVDGTTRYTVTWNGADTRNLTIEEIVEQK